MLTVSEAIQFCRAETGELDAKRISDVQILRYLNYAQLKVQNGFSEINFKAFTKTAYYTGSYIQEPTDLLRYPNSIIDLLTGTGNKSTTTGQDETASVAHAYSAKNFGTEWNGWVFSYSNTGSISVTINWSAKTIVFGYNSGVTTNTAFVAGVNADTTFSAFWTLTTSTTGATTMGATMSGGTTAGATATYWYPADEVSINEFNRIPSNTYKAPSATQPKFVRLNGYIELKPITVQYAKLEYYYRLADLTASDSLTVPAEIEELVLLDTQRRMYEKLGDKEKVQESINSFEEKFKSYTESYYKTRTGEIAEKERLQSADINS